MERAALQVSTLFFLAGLIYTVWLLAARGYHASLPGLLLNLGGFVCQTIFLVKRGEVIGRCPVTNGFEVAVFVCWSLALFYLVIGSAYRMSALGAFTAPLIFFIQSAALLFYAPATAAASRQPGAFWIELHAATALMSYGAFTLSAIAAAVFLVQERQLRSHKPDRLFFRLPPIMDLERLLSGLVYLGFGLLSIALVAGFASRTPTAVIKLGGGLLVWLAYAVLLYFRHHHTLSQRRSAVFAIGAFTFSMITLMGIEMMAHTA